MGETKASGKRVTRLVTPLPANFQPREIIQNTIADDRGKSWSEGDHRGVSGVREARFESERQTWSCSQTYALSFIQLNALL